MKSAVKPSAESSPELDERFRLLVSSVQDYAIFMLDPDGIVVTWNDGAHRINGYRADEIIGRSFETFYTPEAVASGWPKEELRRASALGRFEDEGWRVRKDGSRFWSNVVITALRGPDGSLRGFAKVTRDLSERKRQEEALRQSEERFRMLIEAVKDHAIFMLDPQGHVESWNGGAVAITGYAASEVIGRHFALFYPPAEVAAGRPARDLAQALSSGRLEHEGWRLRRDGKLYWASSVLTPAYSDHGELRGFAHVTRDMSDRRRLVELENSTRRMSEFLAMLAHELRNPLAPIRNAISIMHLQPQIEPAMRQCRDIIDRQLRDLTRLVDDLLDVGRIATGKIALKRERVDYRDVVMHSVEGVQPAMQSRGHRFDVRLPEQRIELVGDRTRLTQALQNVLLNAARYTDPGGTVALEVKIEGRDVVAAVSDNGHGIDPEAIERIFELFVQQDDRHAASESGLGIGLRLARTLVELHGGTLTAASAGVGFGSTFTIRLPLALEAVILPPDEAAAEPAQSGASYRVLVVDDNRDSADTMVSLLGLLGHDARAAYGADQALSVAAVLDPDVVLLDLNMPDANGFTVLQRLRAAKPGGDVRAVAITGYGQHADRQSTLAAGFRAHLTKPVDIDQLSEVLRAVPR